MSESMRLANECNFTLHCMSLLMAQSGHLSRLRQCPLSQHARVRARVMGSYWEYKKPNDGAGVPTARDAKGTHFANPGTPVMRSRQPLLPGRHLGSPEKPFWPVEESSSSAIPAHILWVMSGSGDCPPLPAALVRRGIGCVFSVNDC
jgi:hypothetical protein